MDERDYQAAERALGLESAKTESPDDARLREAWEYRLAPLLDGVEADPPAGLFARIEAAIDDESSGTGAPAEVPPGAEIIDLAKLRGQVRRWRAATGVALAVAAALLLYVVVPGLAPQSAGEAARYVAVVTADDGGQAGLIIQFDTGTGIATVIPVTAPPSGKSYEIWTVPAGATRPVSLGLLPQDAVAIKGIDAAPDQLFAISLEPEGGSPTGQPTEPLYHGRVVRVE
ncbi:hypothetical protein G5B40_13955 [Pikeienuella piscinae]|uniref:Anti-sigma K factor RskA C-terminal domain-containing protein n=1 Tax=Pikeienuella piscinae TaxID=2748098 RepID=A0A7L5C103_9RHOB|nr:anti-sigma factor [Pikeienuella piscinae]QIE56467.1 hypothetical protein G5B40_13955 [Pikeienuella piscinae]